jgi:hypothetical protein
MQGTPWRPEIWIQQRANLFFQSFIADKGKHLSTGILQ